MSLRSLLPRYAAAPALCLGFVATSAEADITSYYQDFESLSQGDGAALSGDGWFVGANVFAPGAGVNGEGGFIYDYFKFPAPNGGPAFSGITTDETGAPAGTQGLVVYSDYNNGDHGNGNIINGLVFREYTIGAANVGETWIFEFLAAPGDLIAPSTAYAFLKTLDPDANFATTNLLSTPTTGLAGVTALSLQLEIVPELEGQLLQLGFESWATGYNASGVNYDNINLQVVPEPSSLALVGLGAVALMRRRRG